MQNNENSKKESSNHILSLNLGFVINRHFSQNIVKIAL